jgi:hypothetical protein
MENMTIYEAHRSVPQEALKPIKAGRLQGMSDINPMFRIKSLTESFGACGIGWYYEVLKQWIEVCGNESVAFVNIALYIKVDGEWSKPIFGTGGSKLVAMERNGAYVSDEAYKMATTDALSVACKQLGIGADVYWQNDKTKYNNTPVETKTNQTTPKTDEQKNVEMKAGVDQDFVPHGEGMTPKRIARLKKAMEFTGKNERTVLATAKATSMESISEVNYIAVMNLFFNLMTDEQKKEIEAING